MGRAIIINVTKKDIKTWTDKAQSTYTGTCVECAVAQACKRKLGSGFIKAYYTDIVVGAKREWVPLPRTVASAMFQMDQGIAVPPFKFKMELPDGL